MPFRSKKTRPGFSSRSDRNEVSASSSMVTRMPSGIAVRLISRMSTIAASASGPAAVVAIGLVSIWSVAPAERAPRRQCRWSARRRSPSMPVPCQNATSSRDFLLQAQEVSPRRFPIGDLAEALERDGRQVAGLPERIVAEALAGKRRTTAMYALTTLRISPRLAVDARFAAIARVRAPARTLSLPSRCSLGVHGDSVHARSSNVAGVLNVMAYLSCASTSSK